MDAKLMQIVGLLAESVDRLSSAQSHAGWCHGACQCGVKAADEAVMRLWEAIEEMEAEGKRHLEVVR